MLEHIWLFITTWISFQISIKKWDSSIQSILPSFKLDHEEIGRIARVLRQQDNIVAVYVKDLRTNITYIDGAILEEDLIIGKSPIYVFGKKRGFVSIYFTKKNILKHQKESFYYFLIIMISTILAICTMTLMLLKIFLSLEIKNSPFIRADMIFL